MDMKLWKLITWKPVCVWYFSPKVQSKIVADDLKFIIISLQKHAYSNILKFSPPKTEHF